MPELVTNGTFNSTTTGWGSVNSPVLTVGASGVTIQNNGATGGYLTQQILTIAGRVYQLTADIIFGGPGFARAELKNGSASAPGTTMINATASGAYTSRFTALSGTTWVVVGNRNDSGASHTYDNISVREVLWL
jgi:hypothetical protein